MKKNGLTWKIFFIIVFTDICDSVGKVFMKKGLMKFGIASISLQNLQEFLGKSGLSGWVWLGVACHILNFCLWIAVLSRLDLSVAAPLGSASYVFVPILAMLFLSESVGLTRWAGILLIALGIHLVSRSGRDA